MSGLPAFQAFRVEKDTPAEELARQLVVDPAVLKYLSELDNARMLAAGEGMLIPYMRAAAP